MTIKLLHTSDLHIDWLFSKFTPQAKKIRRKELIKSLDAIGQLAVDQKVSAVMISGDLFHADRIDKHTVTAVWLSLEKITQQGIKILILPGNHDENVENLFRGIGECNPDIYIFAEGKEVFNELEGLTVYGIPYNGGKAYEPPLKKVQLTNNPGFNVAMIHGTVKTLPLINDDYGPIELDEIARSGLDYIALGHYHNYQDCSSGKVLAYYPGSPNILSFDNTGQRFINIVELGPEGVRVSPCTIPSRPYKVIEYNATGRTLPEIFRQVETWVDDEACVKVNIKGIIDAEMFPLKEKILEQFAESFFYLEINEQTGIIPEDDPHDQSIKGIFVRKISEQLKAPELSEEDRLVLLEALRVGLTAIEGRRLG